MLMDVLMVSRALLDTVVYSCLKRLFGINCELVGTEYNSYFDDFAGKFVKIRQSFLGIQKVRLLQLVLLPKLFIRESGY